MGSFSPPHKQRLKKYAKATQLRARTSKRHAFKYKHNQSSSYYYVCVCAMLVTQSIKIMAYSLRVLSKLHATHLKKVIHEPVLHAPTTV